MSVSLAIGCLIFLAVFFANLPFVNQRLFAVITIKFINKKSLWLRLLELLVGYFVLGGIAYLFESSIGNVFPQGWPFYAITACLFLVFAFPGFVFQYLVGKHS